MTSLLNITFVVIGSCALPVLEIDGANNMKTMSEAAVAEAAVAEAAVAEAAVAEAAVAIRRWCD
jgi:hypothetical protein